MGWVGSFAIEGLNVLWKMKYTYMKKVKSCIKGQILGSNECLIVGRSRSWLGGMDKGENFSVETLLQTMLEN